MMQTELANYITNFNLLDEKTISDLVKIKEEFPFFQTAYLLTVKNLQNLNSPDFTYNLHLTAAYISDRRVLYELLHSEKNILEKAVENSSISPRLKTRIITENLKENISNTLESHVKDLNEKKIEGLELLTEISFDVRKEYGQGIELDEHNFNLNINDRVIYEELNEKKETPIKTEKNNAGSNELLEIEEKNDELGKEVQISFSEDNTDLRIHESSDLKLLLEEPIEFDVEVKSDEPGLTEELVYEESTDVNLQEVKKHETSDEHTFTDWLKLVERRANRTDNAIEVKKVETPEKLSNFELIDKFITSSPKKIIPVSAGTEIKDISQNSVIEHEGYITDTLARIYIRQGYYSKAIFAYEKLILKYPEKSDYFAGQIKEIKNFIKNL